MQDDFDAVRDEQRASDGEAVVVVFISLVVAILLLGAGLAIWGWTA